MWVCAVGQQSFCTNMENSCPWIADGMVVFVVCFVRHFFLHTSCVYSTPSHSQLEAPVRQYLNLPSDQAITPQHLAAALTVSLSPASVRRTCARLGLELDAPTCSTTTKQANAGWHGKAVVEAARERGGTEELLALIKRFREAFVVALRPKFLPKSWNVEHNAARAFGPHSVYHSSSCKPCNNTR